MSGDDWLAVLVLAGVLALVVSVDGLRRREERRAARAADRQEHRRLLDEIRGKP